MSTAPAAAPDPLRGGAEPSVDDPTFLGVLEEAVRALEAADLPYALMGGVSSAIHGRQRWTHDVDIFVRAEDARRALETLAAGGFVTEETYWDWLFKAFKRDVMVDLIFRSTGGIRLDDEMIERSHRSDFRGVEARAIPPEDLLVMKAVCHDEHMPRHWHDALGIIGGADLDWHYLVRRARQYGARRVLALLVYAQSNDLVVPNRAVEDLFELIYRS